MPPLLKDTSLLIGIAICMVSALVYRAVLISNNNTLFWFDQARDAIVSSDMVKERDIKIQGPSASGTNEMVYHGVLYYYIIGPAYVFSGGDPLFVSLVLGIISLLTIIPITLFTRHISKSNITALVAAFLYALSFESAQLGTWLSNPMLALVTIPFFFWSLYRVFWQLKTKELPLLFLWLGLTNQAAIYTVYLFGVVALAFFCSPLPKKRNIFPVQTVVSAVAVYMLSVATIIANQLILWKRGIFDPFALLEVSKHGGNLSENAVSIINIIKEHVTYLFFPGYTALSLLLFCTLLVFAYSKHKKIFPFIGIWLVSPFLLLFIQFRDSYHTFIGVSPALYILLALFLQFLTQWKWGRFLAGLIVLFFVFSNIQHLIVIQDSQYHVASIQDTPGLRDKYALIDYTYSTAQGKPFTISTLTSPYLYNTTWAYLYSWYGQKNMATYQDFWGRHKQASMEVIY